MNERTKIPITWFFIALMTLVGGIFWLSTMYSDLAYAKKDISDLQSVLKRVERGIVKMQIKMGIEVEGE